MVTFSLDILNILGRFVLFFQRRWYRTESYIWIRLPDSFRNYSNASHGISLRIKYMSLSFSFLAFFFSVINGSNTR